MLVKKVYDTVVKYNMIEKGDKILVGFSGGADSLFLVLLLIELKKIIDFELYAAHLNHGIRGNEATRDENFVFEFCKTNNVKLFTKHINIPEISRIQKISEETAGRNERYKFFNNICKKNGFNKIAVAHNMNDSVETVIHNMIRGASLKGLSGIKPVNGNVIRPIIEISRDEIENYLFTNNYSFCTDSTNLANIYTRNKIRNVILKEMASVNESVVDTIYANSINLKNDDEFISEYAKSLGCISFENENIIVNNNIFIKQHNAVKCRILIEAFNLIKGNCDGITSAHLEILSNASDSGKCYDMPEGICVCVSFDKIIFSRKKINSDTFEYNYTIGETLEFVPGIKLISSYCDKYLAHDENAVYIDGGVLKNSVLKVRSRLDGDKFVPYGMKNNKKLKKYFIELKIPAHKRNEIPLIVDDNEVVAIVPYRISELYKVTENTKSIIKFQITKEK